MFFLSFSADNSEVLTLSDMGAPAVLPLVTTPPCPPQLIQLSLLQITAQLRQAGV